jgi:periplasmic divalent cation tolerance protein
VVFLEEHRLKSVPLTMSNTASEPIVVLMTAANREEASRIAEMLVAARLAACVQILPEMQSIYRWQGEVARESEVMLLAKTTLDRFDDLDRTVREIHSYETPEIIALPVTAVSEPYLDWLQEEVSTYAE